MQENNGTPFQVVVGYDFSDQANEALTKALDIAARHNSSVVHVLGVLEPARGLSGFGDGQKIGYQAAEDAQKAMVSVVDKAIAALEVGNIPHFVHSRIGNPAKEVIGLADETGADLIVVGTHGRTGVPRLLMGSVAEKVVRHGTCPVMVVRPKNHPVEVTDERLRPEPPCAHCIQQRTATEGAEWWCDQHAKSASVPHPVAPGKPNVSGLASSWSRFNR